MTASTETNPQKHLGICSSALRALRVMLHFFTGLAVLLSLPFVKRPGHLAGRWYRRLLRILGIKIETTGMPPAGGCLIAANHTSWLDIIILGGLLDAVFVSKAEIDQWPLIGRFARHTGTVFLPRGAGQTQEATRRLTQALHAERSVVLFPEAATNASLVPERFYPRLFAAAIEARMPVQPVAVHYLPEHGEAAHHPLAPWVDDLGLFAHFKKLFRVPKLHVRVTFCDALPPAEQARRQLSEASRQAVADALGNQSND